MKKITENEPKAKVDKKENEHLKTINPPREKTYTVEHARITDRVAYKPWTTELDDELTIMFCEGIHVKDMAKHFGRTKGAIRSRIKKLELEELYG
jgi:hypothetical protein